MGDIGAKHGVGHMGEKETAGCPITLRSKGGDFVLDSIRNFPAIRTALPAYQFRN